MGVFGLRAADLRRFADLATPSFFDVVPARSLWSQGRALLASTRDAAAFREQLGDVRRVLQQHGVPLQILLDEPSGQAPALSPEERGSLVLRLYFAQLAYLDTTALDLRPAGFYAPAGDSEGARLAWCPRPLAVTWEHDFIAGIRGIYTGFYRDDPERFESSAEALGLSAASDLFREQFGEGDQSAVRFDLDRFKQSFHEIFVRCKERGASFHPNFVALGIYLGGLYEHLDALGTPLDVRAAFDAVWPGPRLVH